MKTVFIYALCEPGTRTVRYIGKTDDLWRRFRQHLRRSTLAKTHLGNWLRSLSGDAPNVIILREVTEVEGSSEEIFFIRMARMLNVRLTNATDGGDGGPLTPETRGKISRAGFGRECSPETREKISARLSGHVVSPETRAKIGVARRGSPATLETREKMSRAQKARQERQRNLCMT